jgi:hypothetical protein
MQPHMTVHRSGRKRLSDRRHGRILLARRTMAFCAKAIVDVSRKAGLPLAVVVAKGCLEGWRDAVAMSIP